MKTKPFKVPSDAYLGIVTRHWWGRWWPVAALTVLAIIATGIVLHDGRMAFVAAIAVFIVMPLSLLPIYSYALTKAASVAAAPKTVESTADGLMIHLEADDTRPMSGTLLINKDEISGLSFSSRYIIFHLPGKYAYLPVPYTAFEDKEALRQFSKDAHAYLNDRK
ncbi:MAG: hypothetical protein NC117_04500 [Pseudoflavonifractor sp.]|nr:hypothetical protein [Pseudoflavonifractor sp.]